MTESMLTRVTTTRGFNPWIDRYAFDFKKCTTPKGWAQFDTRQDAPYYGNWINPYLYVHVEYCEGDIAYNKCETEEAFKAHVLGLIAWAGERFLGLDPGRNVDLRAQLISVGLGKWIH